MKRFGLFCVVTAVALLFTGESQAFGRRHRCHCGTVRCRIVYRPARCQPACCPAPCTYAPIRQRRCGEDQSCNTANACPNGVCPMPGQMNNGSQPLTAPVPD